MIDVEHHFETARGIRFHYVTAGEGHPVVLLHGFPQTWYCWRRQIPELSRHFRVIAIDLKGFGDSDLSEGDYHLPAVTAEMIALLDQLGLERPHIVGHDWGGVIAYDIARTVPTALGKLVAINAPLHKVDPLRSWYVYAFQVPRLPELIFRMRGDALIERGILNASRVKNAFSAEDLRVYQDAMRRPGATASALAYYRAIKREALPQNRRRYFTPIPSETLIIWSEEDPILPMNLTDDMHRVIQDLRIEFVPEAGHFLPEEQPEALNRLLVEFLCG